MKINPAEILSAMRAGMIPSQSIGLWTVGRFEITTFREQVLAKMHSLGEVPGAPKAGIYTFLWCLTDKSLHHATKESPGECVMNDFDYELRKHLEFIYRARGRVLITGLGLGCVVRGLLAAGRIEQIDVVERSPEVIAMCGDSVADPRVAIHLMDARERLPEGDYDFAWHDLFSAEGEPHLNLIHMDLFARLRRRVRMQGAWNMRRADRRLLAKVGRFF